MDIEQCKQMMQRLDEVMNSKTSKIVTEDINCRMRGLVTIGTLNDIEKSNDIKRSQIIQEIDDIRDKHNYF